MPHDLHLTFKDIFPDPRDLKRQMLEILPHIRERNDAPPTFTFISITKDIEDANQSSPSGGDPQDSSNNNDDGDAMSSSESDSEASSDIKHVDNQGNQLREFTFEDADDPDLQLSLVKTDDMMGSGWMRNYVAVSYCWPSESDEKRNEGTLSLPVTVKEANGNCRRSKAPSNILRRAVKHAASLSRMYIWIDQECINQDNEDEKQAAIQCMDLVYKSSFAHVVCLLNLQMTDQEHINILEALQECNRGRLGGQMYSMLRSMLGMKGSPEMAHVISKILRGVADDRWLTRAWVAHERLCAAKMSSVELWATTKPGLMSSIAGEVCVMAEDLLDDAVDLVSHLTKQEEEDSPPGVLQFSAGMSSDTPSWVHTLRPELLFGDYSEDERQEAAQELQSAISYWKTSYKLVEPATARRRITESVRSYYNPLQITSILGPLGCLYPSDKIAMMANTCMWARRLDTREIDKRGWSFSLCIWMLAIDNKDGSFFCPDAICETNASKMLQPWAPHGNTSIASMFCSGMLDHVSMRLHHDGLHVSGWLWKFERFLDLSDLKSVIEEIDTRVPPVGDSKQLDEEVQREEEFHEDEQSKLREFFWALLLKLSALREYDCANLVWEAAKLRYMGGFYGRDLQTVPISTFDKIIDPETGKYIACFETLDIPDKYKNDHEYLAWGPVASSAVEYLRQNCEHVDNQDEDDTHPDDITASRAGGKNQEKPCHFLLGGKEQLSGLSWIRSSILRNGGVSLGCLLPDKELSSRPNHHELDDDDDDDDDGNNKKVPISNFAILDLPNDKSHSHVFTLHREVRKYKRGDGKALRLVHPFDVWLHDSPNHTDAPLNWEASLEQEGCIQTRQMSNALFDIGNIDKMQYVFAWPEVYTQDTWD